MPNFAKRFCRAFICVGGALDLGGAVGGVLVPAPIPNPGTDTPIAPSLLTAPWFKPPLSTAMGVSGLLDAMRAGNLGGTLGGGTPAADLLTTVLRPVVAS